MRVPTSGLVAAGTSLPNHASTPRALHCCVPLLQVCRQAGYYEHALYVALAAGEPQAYLDVLLEDCKRSVWLGLALILVCTVVGRNGGWGSVGWMCLESARCLCASACQVFNPQNHRMPATQVLLHYRPTA